MYNHASIYLYQKERKLTFETALTLIKESSKKKKGASLLLDPNQSGLISKLQTTNTLNVE